MELKIKKVAEDVILPTYSTEGAGAFDIRAYDLSVPVDMVNGLEYRFRTGLMMEIPKGWSLLIIPRSGLGTNYGIRIKNTVGLIDSDYRGEVSVTLSRDMFGVDHNKSLVINNGDRIAQGVLIQTPQFKIVEVDELSETKRGTGGFGSTGVK